MADFRWNDWNLEHATLHGVSPEEAERAVSTARPPSPRYIGDGKWLVEGRGQGDRVVRVIYLVDDDGKTLFIIHAMPLTTRRRR